MQIPIDTDMGELVVATNTDRHGDVLIFTNHGRVFRLRWEMQTDGYTISRL